MLLSLEETRPELDRTLPVGLVDVVCRQIPWRRILEQNRRAGFARQVCDQRAMPVDLMQADAHSRELKAVAEQASLADRLKGALYLLRSGTWAIEKETVVLRPYLDVACHRLAVKLDIIRLRAEQDVCQLVLARQDCNFVLVTVHARPAVSSDVRVPDWAMKVAGFGLSGSRLVHPTRLGNAQSVRALVARDAVKQRDLESEGKFLPQTLVGRHSPK
jgi:hypothetical protein